MPLLDGDGPGWDHAAEIFSAPLCGQNDQNIAQISPPFSPPSLPLLDGGGQSRGYAAEIFSTSHDPENDENGIGTLVFPSSPPLLATPKWPNLNKTLPKFFRQVLIRERSKFRRN